MLGGRKIWEQPSIAESNVVQKPPSDSLYNPDYLSALARQPWDNELDLLPLGQHRRGFWRIGLFSHRKTFTLITRKCLSRDHADSAVDQRTTPRRPKHGNRGFSGPVAEAL